MPFLDPEDFLPTILDIRTLLIKRPSATFFMRAKGDDLVSDGICDGDLLVVDRSVIPNEGDIAVVAEDGQLAIRKLGKPPESDSGFEVWGTVTFSITAHCKQGRACARRGAPDSGVKGAESCPSAPGRLERQSKRLRSEFRSGRQSTLEPHDHISGSDCLHLCLS